MKTLRLAVFASVLAVLTGCPGGDKCKDVTCPTGQSCNPDTGMCVNGGVGGGTGGSGGNGGNTGGGDAGPPPLVLTEVCSKLAEAVCNRFERCQVLDAAGKPACVAVRTEQCSASGSGISVRNVNAGNATFNGTAAAECVNAVTALDCAASGLPDRCSDVTVPGKGTVGTPCDVDSHCQRDAGLYCPFNDFPCVSCVAPVGAGAFCSFDLDIQCGPGLSCDDLPDGGGTCRPPARLGESCDSLPCQSDGGLYCQFSADGGSDICRPRFGMGQGRCTANNQCLTGLFCNVVTDGGVSTCDPLRAVDQPCSGTVPCQTGLYCPPVGTMPRNCRQLQADGMPCTLLSQCVSSYCNRAGVAGLPDAGMRTCGYLTTLDACVRNDDCGPGRHCKGYIPSGRTDAGIVIGMCANTDQDGGTCTNSATRTSDSCANLEATCLDGRCVVTPPFSRRLGQTCDSVNSDPHCGDGTHCNYADPITFEGICVAPLNDGEDCFEDLECKPGSYCDLGGTDVCVRYARSGEPCDDVDGPYCAVSLTCNVGPDGGTTCGPLVTTGAMCSNATGPECYSSFCSDGGVCLARQMNGASCANLAQCSSNRCALPDGGTTPPAERVCVAACY